ncbi:MAG: beta-ketoacyl-[acyl-carrier-protein] synthase family protein [Candidatus Omnitrophota bacterium]
MNRRVVVTGIGVISSIGTGKDDFWNALIQGKSGISRISSFDTSAYPTHNGGEIRDFDALRFISKDRAAVMGRASCLAVSAAKLAFEDSGIVVADIDRQACGVTIGTTMGESQVLEKVNEAWVRHGQDRIPSDMVARCPCNVIPSNVALEFGLGGPNFIIPTACAAGNYCIGYAVDLIMRGSAEIMLAGGVDAFSRIAFTGFNRLLAVAPEKCQPFDKNRKGMMVGEAAGILLLEPLESALKRKANIYAEVLGYGLSCDAQHMTAPQAEGMAMAMSNALKETGLKPEDIDYINAHGTGTPANDKAECSAIKQVFGEHSKKVCVSSTKSMLGHTMGAASGIEAAACCLSIKHDIMPPTINYETPDPECDIDCVPNICRRQPVNIALNNASAFGGNNASVIFGKYGE